LIESGLELVRGDTGRLPERSLLSINNEMQPGAAFLGSNAWVEGCRLRAPLTMDGGNVVVGVDVDEPLRLKKGECLDMVLGRDPAGNPVWCVRCYGIDDNFKDPVGSRGATFCGQPLRDWLAAAGLTTGQVWDPAEPPQARSLWNARVFPAEKDHRAYRRWLWMYEPQSAAPEQRRALLEAPRYSAAEMALLADLEAFHARRRAILAHRH
jgi:hypothetical protein